MAVRGTASKEKLIQTIIDATGADFLGIVDKKLYIRAFENGEELQLAVSITCPKNLIDFGGSAETASNDANVAAESAEISKEEEETIEQLLAKLNL